MYTHTDKSKQKQCGFAPQNLVGFCFTKKKVAQAQKRYEQSMHAVVFKRQEKRPLKRKTLLRMKRMIVTDAPAGK